MTEHIALRAVADLIRPDNVLRSIHRLHNLLQHVDNGRTRIAVAALNPHAGERGLFGREEIDVIAPAIETARQQAIDVHGPLPADTVFVRAIAGEFDGALGMYHDQANIARKLLATWEGATIYIGLPVVCGNTALDKVGKRICNPGSLRTALDYTARLASTVAH